jgi:hypothetical protein
MKTHANPIKLPFNQRAPRLWGWALITLVLLVAVWVLAPQQLPLSLYKLSLVTLAAVVGYWLDRSLFPYARPDKFLCSDMLPDTLPDAEPAPNWDEQKQLLYAHLIDDGSEPSIVLGLAMLRRAVIVGCAMLAMGLGA